MQLVRPGDELPEWTSRLDEVAVRACLALEDRLLSDTSLLVEVSIPGTEPFTLGMIIDHAVGTVVVEAIVRSERAFDLVATVAEHCPDGATSRHISSADLRALAEQAISNGANLVLVRHEDRQWL